MYTLVPPLYIHVFIHTCTRIHAYIHTYIHTYIPVHTYIYVCMYIYVSVGMNVTVTVIYILHNSGRSRASNAREGDYTELTIFVLISKA